MTKPSKQRGGRAAEAVESASTKRRRRRLEGQLDKVRELEQKRARQLDEARARRTAIEGELANLASRPDDPATTGDGVPEPTTTAPGEVRGFCLRERTTVVILDPAPVAMRNGRAGLAGTCPSCGSKVVTMSRASVAAMVTSTEDGV